MTLCYVDSSEKRLKSLTISGARDIIQRDFAKQPKNLNYLSPRAALGRREASVQLSWKPELIPTRSISKSRDESRRGLGTNVAFDTIFARLGVPAYYMEPPRRNSTKSTQPGSGYLSRARNGLSSHHGLNLPPPVPHHAKRDIYFPHGPRLPPQLVPYFEEPAIPYLGETPL